MKRYTAVWIISILALMIASFPGESFGQEAGQYYLQREQKASEQISLQLQALREEIREKGYTFEVGYTTAMDMKLEEITGLVVPADLIEQIQKQNVKAGKLLNMGFMSEVSESCSPGAESFDWRRKNGATPVRNQGACGSCWAFSTLGAYEGSYHIINSLSIDASEKDLLDCNPWNYSCNGGFWAHQYLIDTGCATEASYPYSPSRGTCQEKTRPYRATAWGYVSGVSPTISELKQALCEYGPLTVAVLVTTKFQAYTSGVFDACAVMWQPSTAYSRGDAVTPSSSGVIFECISGGTSGTAEPTWPAAYYATISDGTVQWRRTGNVNHGVTLIGWDNGKNAWLIKNSWGTGWGETGGYGTERGYMWMAYDCNNIGYAAAWVQAKERPRNCH